MNKTVNPQIAPYLEAVRARVAGVTAHDLEEVISDLEQHLAEMLSGG